MNIVVVAPDFKPRTGGIAEYTHQVAKHLQSLGDHVVVSSKNMVEDAGFDATCSYRVVRQAYPAELRRTIPRIRFAYQRYQHLRAVTEQHAADLIIDNVLGNSAFVCWFVARRLRVPYVLFAYGLEVNKLLRPPFPKNRWRVRLKRELSKAIVLRRADLVICANSYVKQRVLDCGVHPDKVRVHLPGIDVEHVAGRPIENLEEKPALYDAVRGHDKIVLTVGRLVKHKGIDHTIRAMQLVAARLDNALYLIVGAGPYRLALEALAEGLGLQDRVVFLGPLSDEDKRFFYRNANVFVMPSRELEDGSVEGFGIVFLEANAHGLPVIGGNSGGIANAIADGVSGILVDPWNVDEIAAAITRLLTDEDYAKRLGRQGKERVEREFAWPGIVGGMRRHLESLLRES